MPAPQYRPLPIFAPPPFAPTQAQQPTQWQAPRVPSLANLASGQTIAPPPAVARGVSADPAPAKFVLPSPQALGVSTELNLAKTAPAPAPAAPVDWNQIQARMERLGVLRYQKDRLSAGGFRVTLLLPTSDPQRGQPVEAQAATEAGAVALALEHAEAWAQKR